MLEMLDNFWKKHENFSLEWVRPVEIFFFQTIILL
jgi:hypothetical protein